MRPYYSPAHARSQTSSTSCSSPMTTTASDDVPLPVAATSSSVGGHSDMHSSATSDNSCDDVVELPVTLAALEPLAISKKDLDSLSSLEEGQHSTKETTDEKASIESIRIEEGVDPNIITWDGPDDPANPLNFSTKKKLSIMFTISSLTFVVPLASSMFAPGVSLFMEEFNQSNTLLASFVVSIYILGFVLGPLVVGPISEMYGRCIVYRVSQVIFTGLTIGCGEVQSFAGMFVLRLLSGVVGSTSIALGSGSVGDITVQEVRGKYMSFYILGPVIGPAIGPVIGGFLAAVSWRWVFRLLAIMSALLAVLTFLVLPETYAPQILRNKAARLRKETGNQNLYSIYENRNRSTRAVFGRTITRSIKLLMLSPVVLTLSIFVAFAYGEMYLLFTTITPVFEDQYGFSTSIVGLIYLGMGIGSMISIIIIINYSDRILLYLAKRSPTGEKRPEYRLPITILMSPLVAFGFLVYGWSVEYKVHWFVPTFGTFLVGLGMLSVLAPPITYLVDAYRLYAASANSASTMVRSLGGAFLPLAGSSMYNALGYGWGNTLLAGISLLCWPMTVWIYMNGEYLRKRFNPNLG
ncbi:major facilitator superfamily domain-containing protein [Limtongia smithiae]|uniref:major facilitator superfamily domain-containing protein n=1 Tax=Limtongia smithiae TaxID=1125753 RepID=UPI0034CF4BAA